VECKTTREGEEYFGTLSTTVSDRECQYWASDELHDHKEFKDFPDGSVEEAKNYCRNPDDEKLDGPWCFTSDKEKIWEYCDVKLCEECKKTPSGAEYSGSLSRTLSGLVCQNWSSNTPHSHKAYIKFPDGSDIAAKNYCRNPDGQRGSPWCYTTDPDKRWEYCNIKVCGISKVECKRTQLGTEYGGQLSKTISGRNCQRWSSQEPHKHNVFFNLPDGTQEAAENFCRNPDGDPGGPWCYTLDKEKRWEHCDVMICEECKRTKLGSMYSGQVSQTKTGLQCQNWASNKPHSHAEYFNLPDGSQEAARNYCRNPDGERDGPWCFTMNKTVRWEYCDVKLCEKDFASCKKDKEGTEYQGTVNQTISGIMCQAWASNDPHRHQQFTTLPDGSQEAARNYCRNPDNEPDGPWYYTMNPAKRWEYCNVKLCS
jgi:hypothetical protein